MIPICLIEAYMSGQKMAWSGLDFYNVKYVVIICCHLAIITFISYMTLYAKRSTTIDLWEYFVICQLTFSLKSQLFEKVTENVTHCIELLG